jgi:hypothetical protein
MGEVDTHLNHGVEEEASYSSTSSVLLLLHQYQLQLPPSLMPKHPTAAPCTPATTTG